MRRIGSVTVERILQDIGVRADTVASPSPLLANAAAWEKRESARKYVHDGRASQPCFSFREKGRCSYGESCTFSHEAGAVASRPAKPAASPVDNKCYECGSTKHGLTDCPDFKDRKGLKGKMIGLQAKLGNALAKLDLLQPKSDKKADKPPSALKANAAHTSPWDTFVEDEQVAAVIDGPN